MTVSVDRLSEHEGHGLLRRAIAKEFTWRQVDWREATRIVKNLQQRIFRAVQQKNWRKVEHLCRLLLKSHSKNLTSKERVAMRQSA
jgi:RNA-directed DNA polymerase